MGHTVVLRITITLIFCAIQFMTGTSSKGDEAPSISILETQFEAEMNKKNFPTAIEAGIKLKAAAAVELGTKNVTYAQVLKRLGDAYLHSRRDSDAETSYRQALDVFEQIEGPDGLALARPLNNLGQVYERRFQLDEAERLYQRALKIADSAVPPDRRLLTIILQNLGLVLQRRANLDGAGVMFTRALELQKAIDGETDPGVGLLYYRLGYLNEVKKSFYEAEIFYQRAISILEGSSATDPRLNYIAHQQLGYVYVNLGRVDEALRIRKRQLEIAEAAYGTTDTQVASAIGDLAPFYVDRNEYNTAERLYVRALNIWEQNLGRDNPQITYYLDNLAFVYVRQMRFEEAIKLYQRGLDILERQPTENRVRIAATLGRIASVLEFAGNYPEAQKVNARLALISEQIGDTLDVIGPLASLATSYRNEGKLTEAEALYTRILAVLERSKGSDRQVADALSGRAEVQRRARKFEEAKEGFLRVLDLERRHSERGQKVIDALRLSAATENDRGDNRAALEYSREVISIMLADTKTSVSKVNQDDNTALANEGFNSLYLTEHLHYLREARANGVGDPTVIVEEAFATAQRLSYSAAAGALQQLARRLVSVNTATASFERQRQDLVTQWHANDKALLSELSKLDRQRDEQKVLELRGRILSIERGLDNVAQKISSIDQAHADVTISEPLTVSAGVRMLAPEEALVFWRTIPGAPNENINVFVLTDRGVVWKTIPIGGGELWRKIIEFRYNADPTQFRNFDLRLAYDLYRNLIGPIEDEISDKQHLILVPGPFASLPFHLLITKEPTSSSASIPDDYKTAAWLFRQHAVSILPTVESLKTVRATRTRLGPGKKRMIGFGNPRFWTTKEGTFAGRDKLKPLPETADELTAIAEAIGAPMSDIHLDLGATETRVKQEDLSQYEILYFATHALPAGDTGVGEAALALTAPEKPDDLDDGLLTASEIAQLRLNAEWVVLSACDTAGTGVEDDEPFSGLVRAFFYAGARSLLVSHWALETNSAVRLTTTMFAIMRAHPEIGRAEALRRAMLEYLDNESRPGRTHPGFWGPFAVVGEGASHRALESR